MAGSPDRAGGGPMSVGFLVTSLIVIASPGTGVLYTIAAGLSGGVRGGAIAAFGCTLGIVPHMLAAITGLAALFGAGMWAALVVRYLGVAYLLCLAVSTLREGGPLHVERPVDARSPSRIIASAVLVNLLNPKLPLFFLAFLPQYVNPDGSSPVAQMAVLSGVFMLMTLVVFVLYGAFAAVMRRRVLSRPSVLVWMRRVLAAGLVGLGLRLALDRG